MYIAIFALPLVALLGFGLALLMADIRSHGTHSVGVTAEAALVSPDGKEMSTITITQGPKGIIVVADALSHSDRLPLPL